MPPTYLFLAALVTVIPAYALFHAMSLIIPLYLLLLMIGTGTLYFSFQPSQRVQFEEIVSLLMLLTGAICLILGFAFAPLALQGLGAIALLILHKRWDYQQVQ